MRKYYSILAVDMFTLWFAIVASSILSTLAENEHIVVAVAFAAGAGTFWTNRYLHYRINSGDAHDDKTQENK